jgi:hypothetical protein
MSAAVAPDTMLAAIKAHLKAAGIVEAVIVDDTFDGISSESIKDWLATFIDALGDDQNLAALAQLCPGIDEPEKFGVDAAKVLWARKAEWIAPLKGPAEQLFNNYAQRFDRLAAIEASLRKLGLEVQQLGITGKIPDTVQIVFLDYQLEPGVEAARAQSEAEELGERGKKADLVPSRAEKIAKELGARGSQRPYLVLISEWTNLAQVQADFRQRTAYLGGTFAFLPKQQAAEEDTLYYSLRCWGIGSPALPAITDFFSTVADSIEQTAGEFRDAVLQLGIQDYSFIQRLSLSADGEPLGEYILHLLSESLSHRVRNLPAVRDARVKLDGVSFETHFASVTQPSGAVARLYREAFTDRGAEALAPHPLQHLQKPAPAVVLPRVGQGDIFADSARKHVYLLINPGCDLQYSPLNPERHAEPETLLYLMKGNLTPFTTLPEGDHSMRTEPFEIDGISYRIIWHPKLVVPVAHGDLEVWSQKTNFTRIARLRDIHVASLQQAWTAHMGRIGLPVAPPYFSAADFRIYVKAGEVLVPVGEPVTGEAVLTDHWHDRKPVQSFTLTQGGARALTPAFEQAAQEIEKAAAALPADMEHRDKKVTAAAKAANAARASAKDIGYLFFLIDREHRLVRKAGSICQPAHGDHKPVVFIWNSQPEGKKWKQDLSVAPDAVVIVDFLPLPAPEATPAEQRAARPAAAAVPAEAPVVPEPVAMPIDMPQAPAAPAAAAPVVAPDVPKAE